MLALRLLAVVGMTCGAIAAIRRSGFSRRDRMQLAWILGGSAMLVGGVILYVVYGTPSP